MVNTGRKVKGLHALIVGTGVGIRTYLPAFTRTFGLQNLGFVSRDPTRVFDAIRIRPAYCESEISKAISEWQPELVAVGVPTFAHLAFADSLSSYDKTVLFEKPVGKNISECKLIARSLHPSRTFVNFQLRGLPVFRRMKLILEAGSLSEILVVSVIERSDAFLHANSREWYFKTSQGGGQRRAMLSHLTDLVLFLLSSGEPVAHVENVIVSPLQIERELEHSATCCFEANGAFVNVSSSAAAFGERSLSIEIIACGGRLLFDFVNGQGRLRLFDKNGEHILWSHHGNETSLFRLAFPYYLKSIRNVIDDASKAKPSSSVESCLATLDDAIMIQEILAVT